MEKYQCYECGIKSVTQKEIVFHMNKHHGIKVEEESVMKKFSVAVVASIR